MCMELYVDALSWSDATCISAQSMLHTIYRNIEFWPCILWSAIPACTLHQGLKTVTLKWQVKRHWSWLPFPKVKFLLVLYNWNIKISKCKVQWRWSWLRVQKENALPWGDQDPATLKWIDQLSKRNERSPVKTSSWRSPGNIASIFAVICVVIEIWPGVLSLFQKRNRNSSGQKWVMYSNCRNEHMSSSRLEKPTPMRWTASRHFSLKYLETLSSSTSKWLRSLATYSSGLGIPQSFLRWWATWTNGPQSPRHFQVPCSSDGCEVRIWSWSKCALVQISCCSLVSRSERMK